MKNALDKAVEELNYHIGRAIAQHPQRTTHKKYIKQVLTQFLADSLNEDQRKAAIREYLQTQLDRIKQ